MIKNIAFTTKALILLYLIKLYSWLGLCYFALSYYSIAFLLRITLSLHLFNPADYQFVDSDYKYQAVYILEFEKYDVEGIREAIIERAIKVYPRLRQRTVYYWVNWFFQDVGLEEAKKQITVKRSFGSKKELLEYSNELSRSYFEEGCLQYEFQICKTTWDKDPGCVVIFVFDHVLSDGVGLLSMIQSLTDTKEKRPEVTFKVPFYAWLLTILLMPLYIFKVFYRHSFYLKSVGPKESAFKSKKPLSFKSNNTMTKSFSFKDAQSFFKPLGATFNDFIVGVIAESFTEYHQSIQKYNNNSCLIMTLSVNLKEIKADPKLTKFQNDASGVLLQVPILKDTSVSKEFISALKAEIAHTAKNTIFLYTVKYLQEFGNLFLPRKVWDFLVKDTISCVDIHLSNVPGSPVPIYINDNLVKNIYFVPPIGMHPIFVAAHSYNQQFFLAINTDSSIECNVERFTEILEKRIESYINS